MSSRSTQIHIPHYWLTVFLGSRFVCNAINLHMPTYPLIIHSCILYVFVPYMLSKRQRHRLDKIHYIRYYVVSNLCYYSSACTIFGYCDSLWVASWHYYISSKYLHSCSLRNIIFELVFFRAISYLGQNVLLG